jgi:hypothetical protein
MKGFFLQQKGRSITLKNAKYSIKPHSFMITQH